MNNSFEEINRMYSLVFTNPAAFFYLLALIPISLFLFLHYRRRFPVVLIFLSGTKNSNFEWNSKKSGIRRNSGSFIITMKYVYASVFFLLFIASMIAALAGPQMGRRFIREFRRGYDITLAIDISRSMTVRDSAPLDKNGQGGSAASRLERAVYLAKELIEVSENEKLMAALTRSGGMTYTRFAIALGKGQGILAVPLTSDTETLKTILDSISINTMTSKGTNLETLVDCSAGAFLDNSPSSRLILVFSDGESLSGSFTPAVERAKLNNITVYAVGTGSIAGVMVPENERGGSFVRTFLHDDIMRNAVERCGGIYIDGNSNNAVKSLVENIFSQTGNSTWVMREEPANIWHVFVMAGLVFLGVSVLVSQRLKKLWK
ncbi:MAG: VWA domain-containing protein [Spirochaetaceae bacterium]|nr:VWA domain-containing protein [Spirochaetaceae bacterium]